jgi:hypothetical protein
MSLDGKSLCGQVAVIPCTSFFIQCLLNADETVDEGVCLLGGSNSVAIHRQMMMIVYPEDSIAQLNGMPKANTRKSREYCH